MVLPFSPSCWPVLVTSACVAALGVIGVRSSGGDGGCALGRTDELCSAGHQSSALTHVIEGIYSIVQFDYRRAAG